MFKPNDTLVQFVRGVGPKRAELLNRKGIYIVSDLLEYFPYSYEDRRAARNLGDIHPGEVVNLKLQVLRMSNYQTGPGRKVYEIHVRDDYGTAVCRFFRIPYKSYFDRFYAGQWIWVIGKVSEYRSQVAWVHPEIQDCRNDDDHARDRLIPLYSLTDGLSANFIRKIICTALEQFAEQQDPLPNWMLKQYDLPPRIEAIQKIHQPPIQSIDFQNQGSRYHRRIIFEEFLKVQMHWAQSKRRLENLTSFPVAFLSSEGDPNHLYNQVIKTLPFVLTSSQVAVLREIFFDLNGKHPMHRLVQGDVGSGKTAVALLAAAAVIGSGYQAVFMAPTELLAQQHFAVASKWLNPFGITVNLLTGSTSQQERKKILEGLSSGSVQLCLGTHSLIQPEVKFQKLALAIIDEQHRFGVQQRQLLELKGTHPHLLVMTATPIPRTLAMTIYGDLNISVIKDMPLGRIPITTRLVSHEVRFKVIEFVGQQLAMGRQAYWVCPLVEESEKLDAIHARRVFDELTEKLKPHRVAVLHGKLSPSEKTEAIERFRAQKTQLLVTTTVVEVGVDVPQTTMMIVENAERFGLSQLHQLRGRVGRSTEKSYCVFIVGPNVHSDVIKRIQLLTTTNDGFKIAEADLLHRGPGHLLGHRQAGDPEFKMAQLLRDAEILAQAQEAAIRWTADIAKGNDSGKDRKDKDSNQ